MIAPTGPFSRAERIRRSGEFREIARRGERRAAMAFVVLTAARLDGRDRGRLGLTVSRRVGSAVARNRVKRQVREWFRQRGRDLAAGRDVVVIARPEAKGLPSAAVAEELDRLLGQSR